MSNSYDDNHYTTGTTPRNLKIGDEKETLIKHNQENDHNLNFKDSKMLININNKKHKWLNLKLFLIPIQRKNLLFNLFS